MLGNGIAVIAPEMVAKQHFFLEELTEPIIVWVIRGICILGGITALVIYYKMKNKKGE